MKFRKTDPNLIILSKQLMNMSSLNEFSHMLGFLGSPRGGLCRVKPGNRTGYTQCLYDRSSGSCYSKGRVLDIMSSTGTGLLEKNIRIELFLKKKSLSF